MTHHGYIKNGQAVLREPVALPEGTAVEIDIRPAAAAFRENLSAQELALRQQVKPIRSIADLACGWPADDSVDDFLALVREVRR